MLRTLQGVVSQRRRRSQGPLAHIVLGHRAMLE